MAELSFSLYRYDDAMTQLVRDINDGLRAQDEILSQIQIQSVSHGGTTRQVSEPQVVETSMRSMEAMFEISLDAFLQTDARQFTASIFKLIDSLNSQQKKYLFEVVSQTTDAVGNTINAAGRNVWDAYIEMLETTEMRFDEQGNHNYKVYLHPDTARRLEQNPPTPEQSMQIEKTIDSKRKEYYARKPRRKLSE